MGRIYVVGTADTKGEELAFLSAEIAARGGSPLVVDVGIRTPSITPDIPAQAVATYGPPGLLSGNDRGVAVSGMAAAFAKFIVDRDDVAGIIGVGGGGGTSVITAGMRQLAIGIPKLMVSTLASGDTSAYVGVSDIVMMPSITDITGLNRISRVILAQAAGAITAMAATPIPVAGEKAIVGLTMFGVTTTAVTQIVERIKGRTEPVVFHATGTGGRTMEALVDSGFIASVIDITTTEIADLLFGGVLPAGPDRLDCIARTRVPYVGSLGACDMINFWTRPSVPAKFEGRTFYAHNVNVTLMRTTAEECRAIGAFIGNKLNVCEGEIRILIPEKGVSSLDIEGGVFFDPVADAALFDALIATTHWNEKRRYQRLPLHINEPAFADAVVAAYNEINPQEP